jgi:hypothetical protein
VAPACVAAFNAGEQAFAMLDASGLHGVGQNRGGAALAAG